MAGAPRHVLLIVKATGCGPCSMFEERWPELEKGLQEKGLKPRIEMIKVASTRSQIDTKKYPGALARMISWFPTIMMIPGDMWDRAMAKVPTTNDFPLINSVIYMNGEVNDKGVVEQRNTHNPLDKASFVAWVEEALRRLGNPTAPIQPLIPGSAAYGRAPPPPSPVKIDACSLRLVPKNK